MNILYWFAMLALASLLVMFIVSTQSIWEEVDSCKERFKEECTAVILPNSKLRDIEKAYYTWEHPTVETP